MTHFGSRIRATRSERGWSQDDLAQRAGLHRNTVNKIERTAATPDDVKEATKVCLAVGFGFTAEQLTALYDRPAAPQVRGDPAGGIPVINCAPAGEPADYEHMDLDRGIGWDYVPRIGSGVHDVNAFAFVVVGDSMVPEFQPGDTVICSPNAEIKPGQAVFVRFGAARQHACTFKRIYDRGDAVELIPDNRRYSPQIVPKDEIDRMSRVVAKWVKYE